MEKEPIGKIIRDRRKSLKKSQAEVCNGICDVSTYSRIERGLVDSNGDTLTCLFERLGLPTEVLSNSVNEHDEAIRQVIRQASQANAHDNQEQALALLESISEGYDSFSLANKQRYDAIDTMIAYCSDVITNEERLMNMEKALRMTMPDYNVDDLPLLMTNMEAQILRYIANAYATAKNYNVAIAIYYRLKDRENSKIDKIDASKKLANICYNLSKFLGQVGKYDECINVSYEGIRCCEYTRNINMLPNCMYNCAWALVRRNMYGDKDEAKKLIDEIIQLCTPMTWDLSGLKSGIEKIQKEFFS